MIVERIADGGEFVASGKGRSDELLDRTATTTTTTTTTLIAARILRPL
jgi:hypothetical protein